MSGLRDRAVLLAGGVCVAAYVFVFATGRAGPPIRSDGFSYYVYLPSWVLYHDASLQRVADDCCGGEFPAFTAIVRWPATGRWVNAHPVGVAVLMAPFFVAAHLLTRWTNLSPDGFTLYYQHAAGLAGLFYAVAGLWLLRRLLDRHFTPGVVVATLFAVLLGTSLLHYATHDSTWSHAFSFFLCAALLERLAPLGVRSPFSNGKSRSDPVSAGAASGEVSGGRIRNAEDDEADPVIIGVIAGLMVLVRHTNVIVPLAFVPFRVRSAAARGTVAVVTLLVVLPQLAIYWRATGRPIGSSYGSLGFTFLTPHLFGVLFSVQKGLFFWAPVLLAALAGAAWLPAGLRWMRAPSAIVLVLQTYLIASWWDWQFGASFGHRGFVDFYPLFAVGLAAFFQRVASLRSAPRLAWSIAAALLCALTLFEMTLYWNGVLPQSDTTWAQYRASLGLP